MDWFNLLKEPKLRTGSKITTTLGRDSKEDEEGPCFKKLKEYQEKIAGKTRIMDKNIEIYLRYKLKDMPEEVACAALKVLNETKLSKNYIKDSINFVTLIVDGKEYHIESYWFYDFSETGFRVTMELEVYMSKPTFNVNLYFRVSITIKPKLKYSLSPDKIKEYAERVNWRDN